LTWASIDPPGYDAGKKIKGKKRHILVDTQGLLIHAIVHAADVQDRDGGVFDMATMFGMYLLMKLYADGGYQGPLFRRAVAKIIARVNMEIVKRSDHAKMICRPPEAVGRRTNVRMARAVQASRRRLGESQSQGARISAPRFNQAHAEKAMQSRMISPDRLSGRRLGRQGGGEGAEAEPERQGRQGQGRRDDQGMARPWIAGRGQAEG
jgi:hypothetical protein